MKIGCVSLFFASLVSSAAFAQELVSNGSFELPVASNGLWEQRFPGETFAGWTVDTGGDTQGVVQVAGFGQPFAADGAQCMELNFYVQGGIWQNLTTTPGASYRITFLMAGQLNAGPDVKNMGVDWGDQSLGTVTWSRSGTGGAWQSHTIYAVASSSSTRLHFRGLENIDGGPYLDAVSVIRVGCNADFNDDNFVDGFDYDEYVACFEGEACPNGRTADMTGDGFVDGFDYDAFVEAFETPC